MSQKKYDILIVQALLKGENHIRGLSKDLGTNQTTISRKIAELYNDNVVDYKIKGRNKVFYLKKTLEAKEHAYMAEIHKLLEAINKYPRLRRIAELVSGMKAGMVIVFGSYAKGNVHNESDIDIYADTRSKKVKEQLGLIDSRISAKIGRYTPDNLLINEINKNHIILKGLEQFYEKYGFFS